MLINSHFCGIIKALTGGAENMVEQQLLQLTQQISDLTKMMVEIQKENQELKNDNELLREENEYLRRKLFGTKSEKSKALGIEQLSLFDEAEQECDEELLEEIHYQRVKKKKEKLSLKLDNLPQVDILMDLADKYKECPKCGTELKKVGEVLVRREVKFIPAKLEVHNIYQATYECRKCKKDDAKVMVKAATTQPVIPHSYASPESVAHVMKEKFVNGVLLYRQEQEWKRMGLELSRATMANWVIIASKEWLIPLKERMHELLIGENYAHADETTIQVLKEHGRKPTSTSYMWVYATIKESSHSIRIFDYKPTRAGYNPKAFLKGFSGKVITDCYSGYNDIENVINVYCWAHVRRKFSESISKNMKNVTTTIPGIALQKIRKLFQIEKEIEDESPQKKAEIRQIRAKPLVEDFFSWCSNNEDKVLAGSKTYKALKYALNHKDGLSEYLNDGLLPMTNSLDERTIRPFAIGRKNWLFSDSVNGAEASAASYSIIETAKANSIDPYKYLCYIFTYLPGKDINDKSILDSFMPWNKKIQIECK